MAAAPARGDQFGGIFGELRERLNERFHLQWITLNVQFRQLKDFFLPDVFMKVPKHINTALRLRSVSLIPPRAPDNLQDF